MENKILHADRVRMLKLAASTFAKAASHFLSREDGTSPEVTLALAVALESAAQDVPCGIEENDFDPTCQEINAQSTLLEMARVIRDLQAEYL